MYRDKYNKGGGGRQSAKKITMSRFKVIDSDLGSRFDDISEDEEEESLQHTNARNHNRPSGNKVGSYEQKKIVQQAKGAGGSGSSAKEWVNKVKVPNGVKYGSRFILHALIGQVEDLKPIMPKMAENGDFEFFVRDDDIAGAIRSCSRRIKHGKGDRMLITVQRVLAPWTRLKKEEKDSITEVVSSRADVQNRALELSGFATHEVFTSRDLMMNMTKNNVFLAVVELMEKKYSDIIALSLKNNRLKYLEMASMLPYFAKNLKVLDLSDNHIESISELEKLKGLKLTTLFLENNPVCEKYTKASDYLSAVQDIFPRITMLDSNECSARPDAFNDDNEFIEPPVKPGYYYGDAGIRTIVETFIVQFFEAYDGNDPSASRKNLVAAYDDKNSQFTLSIENLYEDMGGSTRWPNSDNFSFHVRISHNIKRIDKWGKNHRPNRLFFGALDIASQLRKMPATRHLVESFVVDVVLATSSLMIFSVQGLFEEAPFSVLPNIPQLNFFSRTFTVTPKENGASLCVISDELYLSSMSQSRIERYRIQLEKVNNATSAAPAPLPAAAAASDAVPDEATRKAMVEAFCRDSGMLPEWSEKCLVDGEWNYEVAGNNFLAAKANIPAEAFASPASTSFPPP